MLRLTPPKAGAWRSTIKNKNAKFKITITHKHIGSVSYDV